MPPGGRARLVKAGVCRRPDAGWCAGGLLICLSEREDSSEAPATALRMRTAAGWELAAGSGPGTALPGRGGTACGKARDLKGPRSLPGPGPGLSPALGLGKERGRFHFPFISLHFCGDD